MPDGQPAELIATRIDALVRLLADDDERIRRVARENLAAAGRTALALIRESGRRSDDPRVRTAASSFLREARREEAIVQWGLFAAGGASDLEAGAILIARSEYPDLDAEGFRAKLDGYAEVLRKRIAALRSPEAVIDRMNDLLFRELGFRGNREDYYDPRNSYLNLVLERRLGIPISLSAVYLFLARRVGQKLEGVGMPGRFILRYQHGRHARFLDPFDQGRRWTHQDCVAHLSAEGYEFREEYLRASPDRETLARMLSNLLGIYHQKGDAPRKERITGMLAALETPAAG